MAKCRRCSINFLGRCHDYCHGEREGLVELAKRRASARGHSLGEFSQHPGQALWTAQCARCGRSAEVRLNPEPGEQAIGGPSCREDCDSPALP